MAKQLYEYWFIQFDFPNKDGKPYKSSGGEMVWNEKLKREIPKEWCSHEIKDFMRIFTGKKTFQKRYPENINFSLAHQNQLHQMNTYMMVQPFLFPEMEAILVEFLFIKESLIYINEHMLVY